MSDAGALSHETNRPAGQLADGRWLAGPRRYNSGKQADGTTAIETIKEKFGCQAVVISVDPKRQYQHTSVSGSCWPAAHGPVWLRSM